MKKNIGSREKLIRVGIAFIIALLGLTKIIDGNLETVLLIIAVYLALTALLNFCIVNKLIGRNSM